MRVFMLMAAFVAAIAGAAAFDPAEARRGGGGHSSSHSSGRSFSGSHFSGSHFHAPRVYRSYHYNTVPQLYYRDYMYSNARYVNRCAWLRHRALATGSRIWWQRYRACRSGNY